MLPNQLHEREEGKGMPILSTYDDGNSARVFSGGALAFPAVARDSAVGSARDSM